MVVTPDILPHAETYLKALTAAIPRLIAGCVLQMLVAVAAADEFLVVALAPELASEPLCHAGTELPVLVALMGKALVGFELETHVAVVDFARQVPVVVTATLEPPAHAVTGLAIVTAVRSKLLAVRST